MDAEPLECIALIMKSAAKPNISLLQLGPLLPCTSHDAPCALLHRQERINIIRPSADWMSWTPSTCSGCEIQYFATPSPIFPAADVPTPPPFPPVLLLHPIRYTYLFSLLLRLLPSPAVSNQRSSPACPQSGLKQCCHHCLKCCCYLFAKQPCLFRGCFSTSCVEWFSIFVLSFLSSPRSRCRTGLLG